MNMRKFIAEHNPTPKMMGAELVPQAKWESKRGLILENWDLSPDFGESQVISIYLILAISLCLRSYQVNRSINSNLMSSESLNLGLGRWLSR